MALYPYTLSLAVDPVTMQKLSGATGQIYLPTDTSFTAPLTATDPSGNPVTLTANADGILPIFYATSPKVNWRSGSWVFPLVTTEPLPGPMGPAGPNTIPTNEAVDEGIARADLSGRISTVIAGEPVVIQAAATAVGGALDSAGVVRSEWIEEDSVDFAPEDDPENPILSFAMMDPSTGWNWALAYQDREVAFGQRSDGTFYPPFGGTTVAPTVLAPFFIGGDSVAEMWAANTTDLSTLTGRVVNVEGIGGQQSPAISARQGGVPARVTVTNNLIPVSGSVAVTSITEPDGTTLSPLILTANGTRTRTVVVNGARCTLSGTTASGVATYTLAQVGGTYAVPCPPSTPAVPLAQGAGTITILLGPRNDLGPNVSDAWREPLVDIVARYKAMIDRAKLDGGKLILLPVVPRTDATAEGKANLVTLNNALRDLAPQDFADWVAWLKSDAAFTAAGIAKTADDTTDINNGDTPRSFRTDLLHLNAAGYRAANRFITLVTASRGL
ncbi:hypothetical protein [Arthrobacter sp. MDT1-65]